MKKQTPLITILLYSLILACTPEEVAKNTDTVDGGGGTTGQTLAELAGDHTKCFEFTSTIGSTFDSKAFVLIYSLNEDGTFVYDIRISDADTCATAFASGGDEVAVYSIRGTFTADGASATVEGATNVTFDVGQVDMTIRTAANYENGDTLATYLNSACTPSPGFTTGGGNSTRNFSGNSCGQNSSFMLPSSVTVGDTFVNILKANGSALNVGTTDDLFSPGSTTLPTEFDKELLTF